MAVKARNMATDIDTYISELRHTVTVAGLNYEIWWVYTNPDTRAQYRDTMNRYTVFFQISIHAHFVAMLVALYRLYETRRDTYNIPLLLRILRNEKSLNEAVLTKLEQMYKQAKPLWKKVSILRNEAFDHRLAAQTVEEVFKKASVTPNELRNLVEATKELLNELSHAWDKSGHAFNLEARHDTIRLLDDLKSMS